MEPGMMEMESFLQGLGMVDMVYDGKADFSGISINKDSFNAGVCHKGMMNDCDALNVLNRIN